MNRLHTGLIHQARDFCGDARQENARWDHDDLRFWSI
jgi:hypothetical protein